MVFHSYTIFQGKILREGTKETLTTLNEIWFRNALKQVKLSQGIIVNEPEIIKKIEPPKLQVHWEYWALISILLLIIVKLWQKINQLELDFKEYRSRYN